MANLPMVFRLDGATLLDALRAIDAGGANISIALDGLGRFEGIVTDGDVRRALLEGRALSHHVAEYVQRSPTVVSPDTSRDAVLDLMKARGLSQVPIVNEHGILKGLQLLRELVGMKPRPNVCLILAGGRGSRLMPLTENIPKPMVEVAGRPILERLINHVVGFGVRRIVLAVGYRAEVIEDYFKDGTDFGCELKYLREDPRYPLGTGGPVAYLREAFPNVNEPVLVMNGDLVTQFNVEDALQHHGRSSAKATIGVTTHAYESPFGVVSTSHTGLVSSIQEKPIYESLVNAGIYVLSPSVIDEVPNGEFTPITQVIQELLRKGDMVSAWNCGAEWRDVGQPQDLAKARGLA